jgi:hypothetical protein
VSKVFDFILIAGTIIICGLLGLLVGFIMWIRNPASNMMIIGPFIGSVIGLGLSLVLVKVTNIKKGNDD